MSDHSWAHENKINSIPVRTIVQLYKRVIACIFRHAIYLFTLKVAFLNIQRNRTRDRPLTGKRRWNVESVHRMKKRNRTANCVIKKTQNSLWWVYITVQSSNNKFIAFLVWNLSKSKFVFIMNNKQTNIRS